MVIVAGSALAAAPPAAASVKHNLLATLDGSGTPAGSWGSIAVSVDNSASASAGDLYVGDNSNNVVDRLTGAGSYVCQVTGAGNATTSASECDSSDPGRPGGAFAGLSAVAVDPASGTLYVNSDGTNGVDVFTAAGAYSSTISLNGDYAGAIAPDPVTGDVLIVDQSQGTLLQFDPNTSSLTTFATPSSGSYASGGVAVDADPSSPAYGDVYVTNPQAADVDVYDSSGNLLRSITGTATVSWSGDSPTAVATDPTNGNVYVIVAGTSGYVVDEFDASGNSLDTLDGSDTPHGQWFPGSLAVSAASGDLYVNDFLYGLVYQYSPDLILPDVTTGSPSSVEPTTATINGTINPDGVPVTDCHFDYGTDTGDGQQAPCVETVGSGTSPVSVHADISGLTAGTTYHFRLVASNADGTSMGQDESFGPPLYRLSGSASLTPTGATLTATLNPNNVDTTYHFEYGPTTAYGTTIPVADADIGSGSDEVQVSQVIAGLSPSTAYRFRVVATNSAGTANGPDQTLTTLPAALINGLAPTGMSGSTGLSTGGATLNVYLDPQGRDTKYHFDYGTTASYGSSTPTADAGPATSPQLESATISGLAPATTYHFRTVATNSLGTTDGPDSTFTTPPASCPNAQFRTGPSAGLPDCRAYEQVSPEDKGGNPILAASVASSGDRIALQTVGSALPGGPSAIPGWNTYVAQRGTSGWSTTAVDPPSQAGAIPGGTYVASPDLTTFAGRLTNAPNSGGVDGADSGAIFVRNPDGSFVQAPLRSADGGYWSNGEPTPEPASVDLSHIVIATTLDLLASDPEPSTGESRVYDLVGADGPSPTLKLVSVDSGGTPILGCPGQGGAKLPGLGAMSQDGSRIFFEVTPQSLGCKGNLQLADQLYARINDSATVEVSDPSPNAECTTAACQSAPPGGEQWFGNSLDGSKVFFLSPRQLTDDAAEDPNGDATFGAHTCGEGPPHECNLYEYDFNRPSGHNLVDLSAGDTSGLGPQVRTVARVSDDGSHVYFVAAGVLTAAPNALGQVAQAGADNLYGYDTVTGVIKFVAELCEGTGQSGTVTGVTQCPGAGVDIDLGDNLLTARSDTTPDGRYLVFTSNAQLTPDDRNSAADIYEYDFSTGSLVRVSVGHDGQDENGNGGSQDAITGNQGLATGTPSDFGNQARIVSADGQTILFATARPLQDTAANGVSDLYEWHQGEVTLVSGAGSSHPITSGQITPSGQDIVFGTDQGLVPQDTDGVGDTYDARVGGGFSAQFAAAAPCSGDACQGSGSAPPPVVTAASVSFFGPGDTTAASPTARPTVRVRIVHGTSLLVAVRIPSAGLITIAGRETKTVRRALLRAGTYRFTATLTPAARRALARGHVLKLTLQITYAPRAGSPSIVRVPLVVKPRPKPATRRPAHDYRGVR